MISSISSEEEKPSTTDDSIADEDAEYGTPLSSIDPDKRNEYKAQLETMQPEYRAPKQYKAVTSDKEEIYQGGLFALVSPEHVMGNKQAIELIFNDLNATRNDLRRKKIELRQVRSERVAYRCQPFTQLILSIVTTVSTALIAIGASRTPQDVLVIALGISGFVASNAASFITPWNIKRQAKRLQNQV